MENQNDKLDVLLDRLESIIKRQESFSAEIDLIRKEIIRIKMVAPEVMSIIEEDLVPAISHKSKEAKVDNPAKEEPTLTETNEVKDLHQNAVTDQAISKPKRDTNFEKLIGENLINKLGIAITILGVAIGAKYSIDNNLINPLTRIILGYLVGASLLGIGMRLKRNYLNFSAVLVSGAIAIMYFITYAAYDFYGLISMEAAFALMLCFTIFAVIAAVRYDKQVVAHIGLVGAYAVPFLLSEGSGNVVVLFSYMGIINCGILVLAFKKYWKVLHYAAFMMTWVIFVSWYNLYYSPNVHFVLALVFSIAFFAIFYLAFLAYKLLQNERFDFLDIILLTANSFVFYGIGYSALSQDILGAQLLGLFTLANGLIHFITTMVVYKLKLADKGLFYFVAGLVLVFLTIAIPVQLDGQWVTLIWAMQAALLFWIGRTKGFSAYEYMSYPLMVLALGSLKDDWDKYKTVVEDVAIDYLPVFNVYFLTAVLVIGSFVFMLGLHKKFKSTDNLLGIKSWELILTVFLSLSVVMLIYASIQIEIENYWQHAFNASMVQDKKDAENIYPVYNTDLLTFKSLWTIYFSIIFVTILVWINIKYLKNKIVGLLLSFLAVWVILSFLTIGLFNIGELRSSYLGNYNSDFFERGTMHILIKYIGIILSGFTIYSLFVLLRSPILEITKRIWVFFDVFIVMYIWILLSNELLTWMELNRVADSFKLGMSILWGIFAVCLIMFGLWKGKKHVRIFAIVLFAITLLKLFFYDIAHLGTISKTVIFISLGILLLITSFIYNKYNSLTDGEES